MTTAWTYGGTTYNPSTVSYNNWNGFYQVLSVIGLGTWWSEQFVWYNTTGYKTFEQTFSAIGLGVWALTLAIISIVWSELDDEWKNLLLNVDQFDPNAVFGGF